MVSTNYQAEAAPWALRKAYREVQRTYQLLMPKATPMRLLSLGITETWKCGECGHDFTMVRNSELELNVYEIPVLQVKVPRCPSCSSIWDRAPYRGRASVQPTKVRMEKQKQDTEGNEFWTCACTTEFIFYPTADKTSFTHEDGHAVPRCPGCRRIWNEDLQGLSVP